MSKESQQHQSKDQKSTGNPDYSLYEIEGGRNEHCNLPQKLHLFKDERF